jgi:hypothetical protein
MNTHFKSITALAVICTGFFTTTFSQISTGGQPLSFNADNNLNLSDIPEETIAALDLGRLADEDYENEMAGKLPRFAKLVEANFNLTNSGIWKTQPNGDRVWRLKIITNDALATSLYYNNFHLPAGSKLYIWNESGTQVIGAFTEFNNHESGKFATELIYGETCYLEYTEPASQAGQGVISISHVAYAYRYVEVEGEQRGGDVCEVDINCSPEGTNWQDEKRGVVRMQVVDGGSAGWCSASVVNNTSLNCVPYVLSAFHCGEGSSTSDFTQYIFYFNYERPGCGTGTASTSQSMTGCTKKADSNDGGGSSGSDFMLLQLSNTIPTNYNAYYNGWNANNTASSSGVSIHHPAGGRKKISTYTQALVSAAYGVANTHWRVVWAATANGHGVTEGGSSGSPIFNSSGQIVGTLTGGGSFCNALTSPDYYGKVSYHWTSNPNTAGQKLKVWLDPGNTGALTLSGTYAPCQTVPSLDAGISAIIAPSGSSCATSITPIVTIKNFGATTLTSATITTTVDGGASVNYSWTGSLATNATANVTLPTRTVTAGAHTFNATTSSPNGGADANNTNNSSSSSFTVTVANNTAYLILNTDNTGSQTTWQIRDGSNTVVASGSSYGNNQQYVSEICLNTGCYTFTIYDSGNNGICCNNGTGSYSLGDADGIDLITGGTFTASESTAFCLYAAGTCDTIVQTNFANGTPVIYGATSGYITGSNNFGDKEKAQVFDVTSPVYVQDVIVWFGAKEYVSGNANSKVTVNLRQANGTGTATTGTVNTAPGTLLASKDLLITRIDTSGFFNKISFTTPVLVSADYAVGVNFSTLGTNDQVGIVSSTDGDANNTQLAWEMWSDNTWHSMLSAWTTAIDGNLDLGIFPIECPNLITGVEETENDFMVFPNPATDELTVVCESVVGSPQSVVNILTATGQLVHVSNLTSNISHLDISNLASGIYFVQVMIGEKMSVKRVVIN